MVAILQKPFSHAFFWLIMTMYQLDVLLNMSLLFWGSIDKNSPLVEKMARCLYLNQHFHIRRRHVRSQGINVLYINRPWIIHGERSRRTIHCRRPLFLYNSNPFLQSQNGHFNKHFVECNHRHFDSLIHFICWKCCANQTFSGSASHMSNPCGTNFWFLASSHAKF